MVFRPPPMPRPTTKQNVANHTREANARGLASVARIPSHTPAAPVTVKWPGSVVDPKWLKDHPNQDQTIDTWDAIVEAEIMTGLKKKFDPEMFEKTHKPNHRPEAMYVFDRFLDNLAGHIQDLFAKRATLENAKAPLDVAADGMDPDDLKDLLLKPLHRLLDDIIAVAGSDPMPEMDEAQIIRGVWENDIKENSTYCDVTTEEMAAVVMETISDDEILAEARRRGLKVDHVR